MSRDGASSGDGSSTRHASSNGASSGGPIFIQALALGLDAGWRRRTDAERADDGRTFLEAEAESGALGVRSITYSSIGLEPGTDILLWRMAPAVDALEEAAATLLRSGVGRWLTVQHSFIGRIGPSQYVKKPTAQEQSLFAGERSRYLVVYPFTKSTDWYLTPPEDRQKVMNEHMKVGHRYADIRQVLAYSFGLDSQDFVVAYEADDLGQFGDLVRDLRGTESRRSTLSDTPILLGVHRPMAEILMLLGVPSEAAAPIEVEPLEPAAIGNGAR
jgi:chlorite dismutase